MNLEQVKIRNKFFANRSRDFVGVVDLFSALDKEGGKSQWV